MALCILISARAAEDCFPALRDFAGNPYYNAVSLAEQGAEVSKGRENETFSGQ